MQIKGLLTKEMPGYDWRRHMGSDRYEAIVKNVDGPILVLAGPGAGKTYLLADRVKRLLDCGTSQDNITVLTFGRDANHHMRSKLLDTEGGFGIPYTSLPHVSTHHALGYEIVNRKTRTLGLRKADLRIQNDEKVKRLLYRDAAMLLDLSENDGEQALRCKQLGQCKRGSKDPGCRVCEQYRKIMSKCNCIDFDDQVLFACEMLEGDSKLLEEFQDRCHHLLVDEYQDINAAQFRLIELLSRKSRAGLFAVGDDAQSIYQFRGADPGFILRFAQDFPGASTPPLAHSRRCHELIMRNAEKILKTYYKDWTGPHDLEYHVEPGEEPSIWQVDSDRAEAAWVARIARRAIGEKKTVLILAPKKEFFSRICQALRQYGVPHGSPPNLLPDSVDRRLQVLFGLSQWTTNPEDNFLTRVAIEFLINNGSAKVPGAMKRKGLKPETIKRRFRVEKEIASLWEGVSRECSLLSALKGLAKPSVELQTLRDILDGLTEAFEDSKGKLAGEFAKRLALACGAWSDPVKMNQDLYAISDLVSASQPTGFGSVQLMTMRKAKGLEADVVVIVGLEDDIMPGSEQDLEEQVRLFYVSMTRAKQELYLIHSYTRLRKISYGLQITDKKRSCFLDALGRQSKYKKIKARKP